MNKILFLLICLPTICSARELTNCDKANAYNKASQCTQPFANCDEKGNIIIPKIIDGFRLSPPMQSVIADQMRINSENLRAQALAYQMLCDMEKEQ